MANKKVSQLVSKPSVLVTDLFPIADPTTGQLFKTTISDLGTAIGSGVSSVNTLVGAVVLDTDDIQELASPTNRWFTDTRARAAISGGTGISYNSGTGVITNAVTSGLIATALGYTPADDALVVKLAGSQTITGTKTFEQAPLMDIGVGFKNGSGVYNYLKSINTGWEIPVNGQNHNLIFSTITNYVYTFPNASGTIALTSDLTPYALDNTVVKLTGAQTVAGIKTMSNVFKLDDTLQIKNIAQLSNNTGYTGVWAETAAIGFYTGANAIRLLYAGNYNYTMPSSDGTLALTSQLSAYLPLGGGTMTGVLFGASASFSGFVGFGGNTSPLAAVDVTGAGIFSSSVRSSGYYLTGMTAGSGALYYNSGANRVTVANYNASGILDFEVNGGSSALTLNANLSATFKGALSGTSATFSSTASNKLTISGGSTQNALTLSGISGFGNTFYIFNGDGGLGNGFGIYNITTSTLPFYIANTGAATFSSSVTLGEDLTLTNVGTAASNILATSTSGLLSLTAGASSGYTGGGTIELVANDRSGTNTRGEVYISGGNASANTANGFIALQTANTERLRVTYSGNVGIGTTTPTNKLTVSNAANGIIASFTNTTDADFAINLTNGVTLLTPSTGILAFGTGLTERMRISSSGNVGIGTTAPGVKLSVFTSGQSFTSSTVTYSAGSSQGLLLDNSAGTSQSGNAIWFANSGLYSAISSTRVDTNTWGTDLRFYTHPDAIANQYDVTERMRITAAGNLLIGTTSDAGGRLQVNGDIRAYGSFYRETGNITVNNGWTNVFTINTASQRTYLLQIIATNSEAGLSYRYFGVIQGNPANSSYTAVSLASQTMEVQFSGATIQTRLTNSNQFNFNWSITQLL